MITKTKPLRQNSHHPLSKAQREPYTKEPFEKDKKGKHQKTSMKVAQRAKDGYKAREKMLEYSPRSKDKTPNYPAQFEEEAPKYTPQLEDKELEYTPQSNDEMVDDNFDDELEDDLHINCNIISIFPMEYNRVSKVSEAEEDYVQDKAANQKPLFYYVMNNDIVKEQQAIIERPDPGMMYHLKPLFIRVMVDGMYVNKVFVDGGVAINLMLHSLFKKMGKIDEDLQPYNMVLSNYEDKISHILGVIQVDLSVGPTSRSTLFMVITSNANYNLLLRREWIHGISAVPSTLH